MSRDLLSFLVLAVLLGLIFWRTGEDRGHWREWQQRYVSGHPGKSELRSAGGRRPGPVLDDSTFLASLGTLLQKGDYDLRLGMLADSLAELERELDDFGEALEPLREKLRDSRAREPGALGREYFESAGTLTGLQREASILDSQLGELRALLASLERGASSGGPAPGPAVIHWVMPSHVPVREACCTCHLRLDSGQVLLLPGDTTSVYPSVMLQHKAELFGCTVCHRGDPEALELEEAHGPDSRGRSFAPGRLALRSCGLCHGQGISPQPGYTLFPWPQSCLDCHEQTSWPGPGPDSIPVSPTRGSIPDINRRWLLRHWAEKTGVVPGQEALEQLLSVLPGRNRTPAGMASEDTTAGPAPGSFHGTDAARWRCPRCGRIFMALKGSGPLRCPVDGCELTTPEDQ